MRTQSLAASASLAFAVLAAGALGIAATPAEARRSAQAEEVGNTAVPSPAADKKICRRLQITGSRMARDRVCLTRENWKKVDQEVQGN